MKALTETNQPDRLRDLISTKAPDRDLSAVLLTALRDGPDEETLRLACELVERILSRENLNEESSRLLDILLKMMSRGDRGPTSLLISRRVIDLPGASLSLRRGAAHILLGAGAADLITRLIWDPETAEDFLLLARAHTALGEHPLAVRAAERSVAARPGDPYLTAILCDAALSAGQPERVQSAVATLPEEKRTAGIWLREAEARERVDDLVGAAMALGSLLEREPMNAPVRRRLIGLLRRCGREREALSRYREGVRLTGSRLPDDPAALFSTPLETDLAGPIPSGRLDWVRQATSTPVTSREVQDILSLDLGLLGWIQARPERVGELASRVRLSGSAQKFVLERQATGRGALIAGAHVGLLYGGPLAMLSVGLRFGFVASMPSIDLPGVSKHLIPLSGRERLAVARTVIARVRDGETVAIAIDGAGAPGYRTCEIFGRPVPVSDICARLSARLCVPAVFPRILPGPDGTIWVDLAPLPTIQSGETEDRFVEGWLDAWSSEVEAFLTEHPQGMRGSGGFWRFIHK